MPIHLSPEGLRVLGIITLKRNVAGYTSSIFFVFPCFPSIARRISWPDVTFS